jgi:hypothetical protein
MKPARPWMLAHLKIIWQFHAHPVHQKVTRSNGSSFACAYEVLQKVRWHFTFKQYWLRPNFPSFQPLQFQIWFNTQTTRNYLRWEDQIWHPHHARYYNITLSPLLLLKRGDNYTYILSRKGGHVPCKHSSSFFMFSVGVICQTGEPYSMIVLTRLLYILSSFVLVTLSYLTSCM